ncbi:hypothetical protein GGTG_04923 [Gaeumannomyces tritici R3-111a-1]|uniref:Uncharacterized protein n=1 Tax=Gaeumannomyces tritici (strain R3-111a-1) TaxID=644352 RepID=J3NUG7_GAET3|nr:hypothetical protein GGTG_04923 [Gaeumannomyces tritici R3-111a-1]EJT79840.1 hypothetical protein GGTG_04923 [Gaeumannomyces tritici R3-111a-1]
MHSGHTTGRHENKIEAAGSGRRRGFFFSPPRGALPNCGLSMAWPLDMGPCLLLVLVLLAFICCWPGQPATCSYRTLDMSGFTPRVLYEMWRCRLGCESVCSPLLPSPPLVITVRCAWPCSAGVRSPSVRPFALGTSMGGKAGLGDENGNPPTDVHQGPASDLGLAVGPPAVESQPWRAVCSCWRLACGAFWLALPSPVMARDARWELGMASRFGVPSCLLSVVSAEQQRLGPWTDGWRLASNLVTRTPPG